MNLICSPCIIFGYPSRTNAEHFAVYCFLPDKCGLPAALVVAFYLRIFGSGPVKVSLSESVFGDTKLNPLVSDLLRVVTWNYCQ